MEMIFWVSVTFCYCCSQNNIKELERPDKAKLVEFLLDEFPRFPLNSVTARKNSSTASTWAVPVVLIPTLCPPLSRVGDVFQIQGCISPLQFSILGISMCMLFYEVATSYRAVLSLWRLNKCLQSVWWSLQHSEGHMFCFLTIKASPSKILLLNKSPLLAFFSWQLWFDCKKQSLSSITDTFFLLHSAVTGIDKDSAVSRSEPLYQVKSLSRELWSTELCKPSRQHQKANRYK